MRQCSASDTVHIGPLSQIQPVVNFANRFKAQPGQEWGPRIIPDSQLVYVISGRAELWLGPHRYLISAGECVFYGEESPHRLFSSAADPATLCTIHFAWDKPSSEPVHPIKGIRGCDPNDLQVEPAAYSVKIDEYGDVRMPHHFLIPGLEPLFLQIVEEYRGEGYGCRAALRGLLTHLLTVILRYQIRLDRYSAAELGKIEPALAAIRSDPDRDWSPQLLAAVCGYHPTYFTKLFKETTGRSPKHYLVLERIHKAKRMLQEQQSVERVAEQLGYASIHYFSRNFKEVTGYTPSEYRRKSIDL